MFFGNPFDKRAAWLGAGVLVSASLLAACQGCRSTSGPGNAHDTAIAAAAGSDTVPTVRLYLVSDLAGALEPCGCTKDQLGGLDHAASWMRVQRATAPNAALVSAGPLFFM